MKNCILTSSRGLQNLKSIMKYCVLRYLDTFVNISFQVQISLLLLAQEVSFAMQTQELNTNDLKLLVNKIIETYVVKFVRKKTGMKVP